MSDTFNNTEHYGDDLNDTPQRDESVFETQSHGISRVCFLPVILLGGLLATAIVFVAIYIIDLHFGHNLLTWTANFIFPIGAMFGGFLAGIGYAFAARLVKFYPKKRFFFFIFLLQFTLFFIARYLEYTVYCYHARLKMQQKFEQHHPPIIDEKGEVIAFDPNIIANAIKKSMPSFIEFYRTTIEESEWVDPVNKDKPFKWGKLGKWGWAREFFTALAFGLFSCAPFSIRRISGNYAFPL